MKITKNLKELEKRLIGRSVYENDALALCWSLSGFEASFTGERAEIAFVPDITDDQPVYVMTIVDGRRDDNSALYRQGSRPARTARRRQPYAHLQAALGR